MHSIGQISITAVMMCLLAPAQAAEPARSSHLHVTAAAENVCLNQKERRATIESGKLINLAAAIRSAKKRMPGTVVRARLCREQDALVYVLTVLARNGKVARLTVDAVKGSVVGYR